VSTGDLKKAKRAIRREVLAGRDAMPSAERARLGDVIAGRFLALPEVERARVVMAFSSFGSELPTEPLIEALVDRGVTVALPRIVAGELEPRTWRPGEPTTAAPFGALEPAAGRTVAPETIDVVVTPAVAFDRTGGRVGYGGGYYDRFLLRTRDDALRAGVAFGLQLVEGDLPAGAFDLRVDVVVTERETIRCRRGA
jgi:5-formyltetrahydrofolate cyclo-ligase